jgi:hypothetical protein
LENFQTKRLQFPFKNGEETKNSVKLQGRMPVHKSSPTTDMGPLGGSSLADNSGGTGFFQRNGLGKIPRRIPPRGPGSLKKQLARFDTSWALADIAC